MNKLFKMLLLMVVPVLSVSRLYTSLVPRLVGGGYEARLYTNWVVLTHETSTNQVHPFGGRLPIILIPA